MKRDKAGIIYAADCRGRLYDGMKLPDCVLKAEKEMVLLPETYKNQGFFPEKQEINWFFALDTPDSV